MYNDRKERRIAMDNRYTLRIYDEDLITFSLAAKGLEGLTAEILAVDEKRKPLFPLDLELTE